MLPRNYEDLVKGPRTEFWSEYGEAVTFDPDAPADSVFCVDKVRIPGFRNALRVFGSLLLGFVAMGDTGANPSSQKFVVRLIDSGEVLDDFGWSEGLALNQDLSELTAGEFAERWLAQEEAVLEES